MSDKDILYKTALENKEKVNLNYLTIFAERIYTKTRGIIVGNEKERDA